MINFLAHERQRVREDKDAAQHEVAADTALLREGDQRVYVGHRERHRSVLQKHEREASAWNASL